jgi:hypothetical protein
MPRSLFPLLFALATLLGAGGCNRAARTPKMFDTAESAVRYVKGAALSEATFTLAISNRLTFAGRPDTMGAGMAVVMDAILAKRFWPDGFDQKEGYRLYRYKREK